MNIPGAVLLLVFSAILTTSKGEPSPPPGGNQTVVAGGPVPITDVNDPNVQRAARSIVKRLNWDTKKKLCPSLKGKVKGDLSVYEVQRGTSQVVAGAIYSLDLVMIDKSKKKHRIFVKVWWRSWLDKFVQRWEITHCQATSLSSKPSPPPPPPPLPADGGEEGEQSAGGAYPGRRRRHNF